MTHRLRHIDLAAMCAGVPSLAQPGRAAGRGRVQLKAGYTCSSKAGGADYVFNHTYPEMLFDIGMFAEWLEVVLRFDVSAERVDTSSPALGEALGHR